MICTCRQVNIFFHLSDIHNTFRYILIYDIDIHERGFEIFLLKGQFIFFPRLGYCLSNSDSDIQAHNMILFVDIHNRVSDIWLFYKSSNSIHFVHRKALLSNYVEWLRLSQVPLQTMAPTI